VGLLSIGEEAGKGNDLVKGAYPLLEASGLNFFGNVEGKEIYGGSVDVVVTDGFSGNVFLKSSEAVAKLLVEVLKEELMGSLRTKIGALLAKPAFDKLRAMLDPAEVGAALLLGVNGMVFIGHGRSNAHALVSAIRQARQTVEANLLGGVQQAIQEQISKIHIEESA
jgi:phosphate acyltransferase